MAEQEPVVSVRNIPQSQYEAAQAQGTPVAGGGGIQGHLQRNWPMYALGVGLLTIVVMIYLNYRNSAGTANTSTTGTVGDWGAQLDSDYQQSISNQNAIIGLLTQISNNKNGSGTQTNNPTSNGTQGNLGTPTGSGPYYPNSSSTYSANDIHGLAPWQTTHQFSINTNMKSNKAGNVAHFVYPEQRLV